jgi:predicted MFS family arabinose efflux permease
MAIHEALLTVGALTGALGGGFLYQASGMPVVFVVYGVMLLATAGVQALLLAGLRRRAPVGSLR